MNNWSQILSKCGINGLGEAKTFPHRFYLSKSEHVLIVKLLELLIDTIDTNLFNSIVVKDVKTSNIRSLIDGTSNTSHKIDSTGTEVSDLPLTINTGQGGNLLSIGIMLNLDLFFFTYWD